MSEATNTHESTANTAANEPAPAPPASVDAVRAKVTATINTLVDLGAGWASKGLGYLKLTMENGARALERTAKTIETYQERFKPAGRAANEGA